MTEIDPENSSFPVVTPKKNSFWRKLGGGSLTISIIVHVIFLLIAAIWIIRIIPPLDEKKDIDFMPTGGGGGNPASQERNLQKQKAAISKPTMSRIAVTGAASSITLPDMEDSSQLSSLGSLSSGAMSGGLGGSGSGGGRGDGKGVGFGSGTGPGSGIGSGTANPFGVSIGAGLVGTFYDFKRDASGKATDLKAMQPDTRADYKKIIDGFAQGMTWNPPRRFKHFRSPTQLIAKTFAFQGIPDTRAGQAFKAPDTQPGVWVAHYSGTVRTDVTGKYRLVGWGDNCLVIGLDGKVVLDASDAGYTDKNREALGEVNVAGKPRALVFRGPWIDLRAGKSVRIDVLLGDEGGIFSAAAFWEKEGDPPYAVANGLPKLPVFRVGPLSDDEKKLYAFLPAECLSGPPIFTASQSAF